MGERAIAIKGDAGSIPDIERMVSETVKRFGKIDILVPCAGMLLMKDLEHTTEQDFDNLMRLNVKGPYFLSQVRYSSSAFTTELAVQILVALVLQDNFDEPRLDTIHARAFLPRSSRSSEHCSLTRHLVW